MCGIAGCVTLTPAPVARELTQAMCRTLTRRGPDEEGYFHDDYARLGVRRLSIIGIDGGHQPISNEAGTLWIVFNGEIFNYVGLRCDLMRRGHRFKSHSDTEVVLHLFEDEGPRCFRHFRGMFALAIWNTTTKSFLLARDRLGIKPLHYYFDERRFLFASEIKALLIDDGVPPRLDPTAIDAFFAYGYVPAPWTAYRDIKKLAAGHYLLVQNGRLSLEEYWDLAMEPKWSASADDLGVEFLTRFKESVKMHLMGKKPLGAYLSGGVDSGLLVATMARESHQPINTFTIGYGGHTGSFLDERPIAREVAARFGTQHRECEGPPDLWEAVEDTLCAFDEPFADDALIPTHQVCALARQHVIVALTGLGGDENFAGYERYRGFALSASLEPFLSKHLLRMVSPGVQLPSRRKGRPLSRQPPQTVHRCLRSTAGEAMGAI